VLLSIALFGFIGGGLRLLLTAAAVALLGVAPSTRAEGLPVRTHLRARINDVIESSGPWLALGLLVGALLLSVPVSTLAEQRFGSVVELLIVAAVANLTPVAAPAAVLIAVGMHGLGVSAAAVLLFACLAPLSDWLGTALKPRLIVTLSCFVCAVSVDRLRGAAEPLEGALSQGDYGTRAALVLTVLLVLGIWQRGARRWLATIVRPPPHEHEHAHDVHGPHAH
jgi:hypothetical protein